MDQGAPRQTGASCCLTISRPFPPRGRLGASGRTRVPQPLFANLETETLQLERKLTEVRHRTERYKTIEIFDPGHWIVSAAPLRDRAVRHAFCAIVEQIFERDLIPGSYANRKGKGTHRVIACHEAFRNRLRELRDRWREGSIERGEIERRVGAWIAHAEHADTRRLRRAIFRDGWFDPSRRPGRPPVAASCAGVPGTTNRGTSAPPTATGTIPETETTMPGSVSPVRSKAGAETARAVPGAQASVQGHDERAVSGHGRRPPWALAACGCRHRLLLERSGDQS